MKTRVLLGLVLMIGCSHSTRPAHSLLSLKGGTMGTTWAVTIVQNAGTMIDRESVRQEIEATLHSIEKSMSIWDPTSTLSRLNAATTTGPFDVEHSLFTVFSTAREINQRSGGAFDISILPLIELWGFGPGGKKNALPSSDQIETMRTLVGPAAFSLDHDRTAINKTRPNNRFDVSAIAKGFAVDEVAELLDRLGHDHFLVEIGGEVRAAGRTLHGTAWKIGIERPDATERLVQHVVCLDDRSMATSGDYRNYFVMNGKRYSHTIDPRTGFPIEHSLASVSVIHEKCMVADAWATALNVLGPKDGLALAEIEGLAACFILRTDRGFKSEMTSIFPKCTDMEKKP